MHTHTTYIYPLRVWGLNADANVAFACANAAFAFANAAKRAFRAN